MVKPPRGRSGMRRRSPWPGMALAVALGASFLGVAGSPAPAGAATQTITLYNGQHPQLTQAIVRAFEKKTGIQVKVRTNDGITLADQLLQEGSHSPADVYLTENSPELMLLSEHHLLAKLPASITDQIPSQHDSPTGNWVGVALRVSALSYDPSEVRASQLPTSILALAQPRWKGKVAIAPTDSDFVPLVGAVIAARGKEAALHWLDGLKANSTVYPDIESVVAAVDRGQQAVGVINQYYWYRLRLEKGTGKLHSKLYYFPSQDPGAVENVSGAAVLASSQHKAAARRFVDFLVSPAAQRIIAAGDDYEYPARPGIAPNRALPALTTLHPDAISVAALGDDQTAASLLQQAGLT